MDDEIWPRQPCPEVTGSVFESSISRLIDMRAMRAQLRTWIADPRRAFLALGAGVEDLLVIVDELASNGLRHGRAPVHVCAVQTAGCLLLDVSDGDWRRGPEPAYGRDPVHGGMGLRMIAHLTVDRGWTVTGGRKHVWACFCAN
jgi:hypothetical protein